MLSSSKIPMLRKKLSQELWTSVTPKLDQLVPYMCGPSDPILEGGVKVLLEIFFFRKKICRKRPKSAIFSYIRTIGLYRENHKIQFFVLFCMDFVYKDPLGAFNCKIKWIIHFLWIMIFGFRETKTGPRSWNVSYVEIWGKYWNNFLPKSF